MLLSEMFGVEQETDFGVKGYSVTFKISTFLGKYEYLMYRWSATLDWREAEGTMLCNVIAGAPGNIIHLPPPLTDEQREQLKSIWTLGGRWLAKDYDDDVNYYINKPQEKYGVWCVLEGINEDGYKIPPSNVICKLQGLNKTDDEPYDIGKALGIKR